MRLHRDSVLVCIHSGLANKETRVKVQFIPTESSCAGRTESGMGKGPWTDPVRLVSRGLCKMESFI